MGIEKMSIVSMTGKLDDLDKTILKCCENGDFHPELPANAYDEKNRFSIANQDNPYSSLCRSIDNFCLQNGIIPDFNFTTDYNLNLNDTNKYFNNLFQEFDDINSKLLSAGSQKAQYENTIKQIIHIIGLNYSFEEIFSCEFIGVRFGRIPNEGYEKLSFYKDKPFFFISFDNDDDYHWGVYFMPRVVRNEIDYIFQSLYFERIFVPESAHGTPIEAKETFENNLIEINNLISELKQEQHNLVKQEQATLSEYYSKLKILSDCSDLHKYVVVVNDYFHLDGYIPSIDEDKFTKSFDSIFSVDVSVNAYNKNDNILPPVKLKNNRFVKPFESFVEMYGTPEYNEIDPTPFVAITYTLLFGIMFGDLGQGVLISLIGIFLSKFKKIAFGQILTRIGISSAFFGFLYGSVFGYENLLDPFYINILGLPSKPIEVLAPDKTNFILFTAIGLGVLIIIISMIINIYIGIRQKDIQKALFSQNGVSGLILFSSAIIGAALLLLFNVDVFSPWFICAFIVFPILVIFFREILTKLIKKKKDIKPETWIGFISENFFEMFEILLSYVTNTMSFLRVAGFILSHAGMMAVVFTLSGLVGGGANIIVVIIGNIFVMGVEGLIVGIQVLRLEFFEIFSRFYSGEGRAYTPVKINKK